MIASPLSSMSAHYDVVVVGSGYGGSIMASRLARAGSRVCLLERGPERWPGDFPDGLLAGVRDIQAQTADGRIGSPTALYDLHVNADMNVLVGCGLGGTSLINANVALRPGRDVFDDERWPQPLRGNRDLLEPYFETAERWLGSEPYPRTRPTPPKLSALDTGALAVGENAVRPPINVTFTDAVSAGGVAQPACNDCGDCVSGCNVGAKNTVLMNYLPDAHRHGAEIFCEVEVDSVVPAGGEAGRWTVWYRPVATGRARFGAPDQFVSADTVVLAAGTLGSTEIVLRSRARGLTTSDRVGRAFSGNGDVLGFGVDADRRINALGWGRRDGLDPVAPTITGVVDLSDERPPGHGLVVEEGAFPSPLRRSLPLALTVAETLGESRGPLRRVLDVLGSWRRRAEHSMVYLVMSADDDDGELRLENDRVRIDWRGAGSEGAIIDDNDVLEQMSGAIGARYVPDPIWKRDGAGSLVTVHPLGGCVMADDASGGVVDHLGRVFSGTEGTEVHEGLLVVDGSIVPRPLDLNPLLTISALAERTAAEVAAADGRSFDTRPADTAHFDIDGSSRGESSEPTVGIAFTERMAGWFHVGSTDHAAAERAGRSIGSTMDFVLTLDIDDLDATVADAATVQRTSGTVTAPALSAETLAVEDGRFQLMVPLPDVVDTWHMVYGMTLVATDGRRFRFDGFKVMHEGPLWRAWRATTTLYVDVTDDAGAHVGSGILHIGVSDLVRQLSTARVANATGALAQLGAKARFARAFLGDVMRVYGGPLD